MNGGQAYIATAGAVGAVLFQMVEEGADEDRVQVRDGQLRRRFAQPLLSILDQQAKGIAIAGNGGGTRLPLPHQAIQEERLQQHGKWASSLHGCALRSDRSTRFNAARNNCGVAVRYHCVSVMWACPRYVDSSGRCRSTSMPRRYQVSSVWMASR